MGRTNLVPFLLEDRIREVRMQSSFASIGTVSCAFCVG